MQEYQIGKCGHKNEIGNQYMFTLHVLLIQILDRIEFF